MVLTVQRMPVVILLTLFVLIDGKTNDCLSEKLDGCLCTKDYVNKRSLFTVKCEGLNFVNTEMLKTLPEETQRLIFTGNHIPVLENNLFGDRDLSSLEWLDLSNNEIREIKGQSFHHVQNVEMLILDHNNISISNQNTQKNHHPRIFSNFYNLQELHLTNAFADNTSDKLASDLHDIFVKSNLTKLYKLHLEQNEIKGFQDANVFCDLPELHDLHLGQNNLPYLNFNISCINKLRYLDLEKNDITKFSLQELDRLDKLSSPFRLQNVTLEIEDNPLKCGAEVNDLYYWLKKTNVKVKNKDLLMCYLTSSGRRHSIPIIRFVEAKSSRLSQSLVVLLLILVIILITLLSAYVFLKRESLKKKLNPFFENVTRKVRYTSIESQHV